MKKKNAIDVMLDEVRAAIARCDLPERDVYDALLSEADVWQMCMQELELEDKDES